MEFIACASAERRMTLLLRILFLIAVAFAFFFRPMLIVAVLIALITKQLSRSEKTMVRIDETGIRCRRGNKTQWYFLWDEIDSILPCKRYGIQGLALKVSSHSQLDDLTFQKNQHNFYFEACPEAKTSIQSFAPDTLT